MVPLESRVGASKTHALAVYAKKNLWLASLIFSLLRGPSANGLVAWWRFEVLSFTALKTHKQKKGAS
jgi:hypothetical protein